MAKMTNLQIEHARHRLHEIKCKVLGPRPTSPAKPGGKDLIKLIADEADLGISPKVMRDAAREVMAGNTYYSKDNFMDKLAEKVFALKIEAERADYIEAKSEHEARSAKFLAQATAVEDAIILGDGSEALEKLNELAEFKFDE